MSAGIPQFTVADVERIIGLPFERTARQCHAVSSAIVRSRAIPGARVARGACDGVPGQHSWVVVGDPYEPGAPIVDATLWSYDETVSGIWTGRYSLTGRHTPHGGEGRMAPWRITRGDGGTICLAPLAEFYLPAEARDFLATLGPLDATGWMRLGNAPVRGWPAAAIIAAMADTPQLRALVPIDRLGMLTDRNPGGSYLPEGGLDPIPAPVVAEPVLGKLEANGVECIDCPGLGSYYRAEDGDDPEDMACPMDDGEGQEHSVLPVHISDQALGRPDDDDNFVPRQGIWAYQVEG